MNEQRKPNLIIDFDGVLHSYTSGWQGARQCSDPPVPGAKEFLTEAVDYFTVCIMSSRTHQEGGILAMSEYCAKHFGATLTGQLAFPHHKPPAVLAIDDRVLRFEGTWPSIAWLKKFKPWTIKDSSPDPSVFDSTDDKRIEQNLFRHKSRLLTGAEKAAMQLIKDEALSLHKIMTGVGDSREMSLAKTKLEEAVMWAVKHITR